MFLDQRTIVAIAVFIYSILCLDVMRRAEKKQDVPETEKSLLNVIHYTGLFGGLGLILYSGYRNFVPEDKQIVFNRM